MALAELPFLESFDHYTSGTTTPGKWSTGGSLNIQAAGTGRSGLNRRSDITNGSIILTGSYTTIVMGMALENGFTVGPSIFRINVNPTTGTGGAPQITLRVNNTQQLVVDINREGGAITSSSPFSPSNLPMVNGVWYYFEMKVVTTSTTITVDVRVNNTTLLSGFTHTFTAFTSANLVTLFYNWANGSACDIYANNSDFYGDGYVVARMPNGVGNYSNFTPTSGANWTTVDEVPPSTVDYNASANVGDKDSYAFADFPTGITVKAVQTLVYSEKDNTGTAGQKTLMRISGADYLSPTEMLPSNASYAYFREGTEVSPATGVAFTITELNAMEVGLQRTS